MKGCKDTDSAGVSEERRFWSSCEQLESETKKKEVGEREDESFYAILRLQLRSRLWQNLKMLIQH